MAILADGSLPYLYDFALNGVGYLVSWEVDRELLSPWKTAYLVTEADTLLERTDISNEEMTENKLDLLYWVSQRSWDYGAGQARIDQNLPNYPSERAFQSSVGVDLFSTIGQASLLPSTQKIVTAGTGTMAATDRYIYTAVGGPNLSRVSTSNGSDATTVPNGAVSHSASDLATDGKNVWCAVGVEGVSEIPTGTNTQLNSFDAITNFSQSGGSPQIITNGQVEGTGFLRFTFGPGSNPLVYTYGTSQNWSSYVQFSIDWAASINGNPGPDTLTVRFKQDSSNYFYYTIPAGISWNWRKATWNISDMAVVGTPSLSTINSIEWLSLIPTVTSTFDLDDLEATNAGNPAIYSTVNDCEVIAWAKDSLYGAGLVPGSSTQWQFFSIGPGSTSTVIYILPDGFTVSHISELAGFIYFAATKAGRSQIYAWDGTNAPFVAVAMPPGETALTLIPFLGAGMLIGGRRQGTHGTSVGLGVLYRAFPQSNGTLTIELIQAFGADDGYDYGIGAGTSYLDKAYFTINNPQAAVTGVGIKGYTGLGVYFPTTGGWSTHIGIADTGTVATMADATVFHGQLVFSIAGTGVWMQQSAYLATGYLTSSLMDWNIDKTKMILQGEIGSLPLGVGSALALSWSQDGGNTFMSLSSIAGLTFGTTPPAGYVAPTYLETPVRVSSGTAVTRVTFTQDIVHLPNNTPILKKAGLGAIYGVKPRRIYQIAVKAYQYMDLNNKTPYPLSGAGLAANIEATLSGLRDSQTIVQFQPVGYGEEHTTVLNVRVAALKVFRQKSPERGWANLVLLTCYEVP